MLDRAAAHQLEVVDDDQPEVRLACLQSPRLRPDLEHRGHARVVDVDRRLRQRVARLDETRPVVGRELAGTEALKLDARLGAHEPLRDLDLGHLEREDRDRDPVLHGEVRRDPERERRLAHARAAGDDDEVARLEAGRHRVDVAEPGGRAGHLAAGLVHLRDLLEALAHEDLDVVEAAADPVLREVEHHLLGLVDELVRLARPVPAEPLDLLADEREPAERRHLAHDLRVVARVRRGRDEGGDLVDPLLPADLVDLAALVELVGDRDRVDRLAVLVQLERGEVDLRVRLPVEVAGVDDLARRPRSPPETASSRRERTPLRRDSGAGAGRSRGPVQTGPSARSESAHGVARNAVESAESRRRKGNSVTRLQP